MKKLKKFSEICRKSDFAGQCYAEEEKKSIIFAFNLANGTFVSLYGVKEVFSIECWSKQKKSNSFLKNNTNRLLVDSVMRKEENRPMIAKMYRSICIYNGKVLDFGYTSPLFQRGI